MDKLIKNSPSKRGEMGRPVNGALGTQSIERAIGLLREVSAFGKEGARLTDLLQRCRMEYPTAHRILAALVAQQVLHKDAVTRRYRLGQLMYELSLGIEAKVDIRRECNAMTDALAQATGDTVFLNIRSGWDVVCIDRKEGSFPIRTFVFDVGSRRPLGVGAAGIALLLSDTEVDVERILRANNIRFARYGKALSVDQLTSMVNRGRQIGYVAIGDVAFPGVRAVSVPFTVRPGAPMSAVSVAAVSSRLPRSRIHELVALMNAQIQRLRHAVPYSSKPT